MYKLVITVSSPTLIESLDMAFMMLGTSLDAHQDWREGFNRSFMISWPDYQLTPPDVTETWNFSTLEKLNNVYSAMNDADPAINKNRPYTIEDLNSAFKQFGISRRDSIVDPDGNATVLFDSENV